MNIVLKAAGRSVQGFCGFIGRGTLRFRGFLPVPESSLPHEDQPSHAGIETKKLEP